MVLVMIHSDGQRPELCPVICQVSVAKFIYSVRVQIYLGVAAQTGSTQTRIVILCDGNETPESAFVLFSLSLSLAPEWSTAVIRDQVRDQDVTYSSLIQ